jgi:hypothetical protein
MECCAVFANNMHSAKWTKSWSRDRLARLDPLGSGSVAWPNTSPARLEYGGHACILTSPLSRQAVEPQH